MKRNFKRILSAMLVCFLLAAILASCVKKENDAPDGMMIASAAGADYMLYVPTTWNLNTYYGVSGAYRDAAAQSTVSVQKYASGSLEGAEGENRNALYWETVCLPQIKSRALNGEVTPVEDDAHPASFYLGGKPAEYRHVTALVSYGEKEQKTLHFVYAVAERSGYFYVLSYSGTDAAYELCKDDLDKILTEFTFTDTPYAPSKAAWKPAKVTPPEGMQVASSDEVAYRFFAPADWKVDVNQRIFAAVEPNDRSNVSMVAYLPAESGMSVAEFHQMTVDLMGKVSGEGAYAAIAEQEGTLGGKRQWITSSAIPWAALPTTTANWSPPTRECSIP